ncbi:unnamed protein product [Musa textilis]
MMPHDFFSFLYSLSDRNVSRDLIFWVVQCSVSSQTVMTFLTFFNHIFYNENLLWMILFELVIKPLVLFCMLYMEFYCPLFSRGLTFVFPFKFSFNVARPLPFHWASTNLEIYSVF